MVALILKKQNTADYIYQEGRPCICNIMYLHCHTTSSIIPEAAEGVQVAGLC